MKNALEDIFEPKIPVVPPSWAVLPFEQAADVVSDKGKRVKQGSYLLAGKIPIIDQGQDAIGGYTDDEDMAFDDELPVILFGDHTRSFKYIDKRFAVGAEGVKILRPREGYVPKFFYYLLRSLQIPSRGYSRHFQFLRKFHLPLAPEEQQRNIVAEIEKQFSRLDEAVANLKRVKANLKRYKASILKAAVEGRLVPTEAELAGREGRSYETGEQLLHRTLDARRSQGNGMFTMPAGPIVRDLPELPAGWSWVSAVQACDPVVDCHNKTAPYINAGIPLVRTTNIRDGRLVLKDLRYVDQPTYEYWSRRCPPQPGDVLFTREAPMGEAGIIPAGLQLCLGQRTMLMRPSSAISTGFLLASLMSPVVKALIDRVAVGSGVKHLRVGDVERLPIPLPPLVEQHRIVAEVERRLSVIEELEAAVEANLTRADRLRQAVLSKAFVGALITSL